MGTDRRHAETTMGASGGASTPDSLSAADGDYKARPGARRSSSPGPLRSNRPSRASLFAGSGALRAPKSKSFSAGGALGAACSRRCCWEIRLYPAVPCLLVLRGHSAGARSARLACRGASPGALRSSWRSGAGVISRCPSACRGRPGGASHRAHGRSLGTGSARLSRRGMCPEALRNWRLPRWGMSSGAGF